MPTGTYVTEPRSARSPACCPPTGAPATRSNAVHRPTRAPAPRRLADPVRHHRRHAPPGHRDRRPIDLAAAEPKKLRYRLLHVAARITRTARRTGLRIAEGWPWATDLVNAFARLTALPQPVIWTPPPRPDEQHWRTPATAPGHQHAHQPGNPREINYAAYSLDHRLTKDRG